MVHGRPRQPQSQGFVERANGDIKDMLISWMSGNNSQDYVVGIKFVQQMKNASYHAGIKRTPYTSSQPDDQLPASLPPPISPSSP